MQLCQSFFSVRLSIKNKTIWDESISCVGLLYQMGFSFLWIIFWANTIRAWSSSKKYCNMIDDLTKFFIFYLSIFPKLIHLDVCCCGGGAFKESMGLKIPPVTVNVANSYSATVNPALLWAVIRTLYHVAGSKSRTTKLPPGFTLFEIWFHSIWSLEIGTKR